MSRLTLHNFPLYIDRIDSFDFNEVDMGESTISTSVMVDADFDPNFTPDWSVEFENELFILDSMLPTGVKDTSSMRYKYSLIFKSEILELDRYPFLNMVTLDYGDKLPNLSSFTFNGTLQEFIDRFNMNLSYYIGDKWKMTYVSNKPISEDRVLVTVSNSSLWDMLTQLYDLYDVRWGRSGHEIQVGKLADEVEHIFEYGEGKGLYSIERVNPNESIYTRLIGTGGATNMPHDYFKTNDPDTNDIIKSMHFTGIVPKQYRDYIRGWNSKIEIAGESEAYNKGVFDAINGKKMQPINYAEDNVDKWGVRYGSIQPNDEIYPTIQGVEKDGLGRIDEIVAVEQVTNDDWEDVGEKGGSIQTVSNATANKVVDSGQLTIGEVYSDYFNVYDSSSFVTFNFVSYPTNMNGGQPNGLVDAVDVEEMIYVIDANGGYVNANISVSNHVITMTGLNSGRYKIQTNARIKYNGGFGDSINVSISMTSIKASNPNDPNIFSDYFNVWIKDIGFDLRDPKYWVSENMAMMFSDGMLAGEDYEFEMMADAKDNEPLKPRIFEDDTKEYNGVKSKYRILLKKSDAELEASGRYLPNMMQNAKAGDHFFLINISLPHDYILNAEQRVSNWLEEEVAKTSDEFPTYTIKPSSIFMADFNEIDKVRVGSKLRIRDERLISESYLPIYIQSQARSYKAEKMLPDYDIVVSDKVIASRSVVELLQSSIQKIASGSYSKQQIAELTKQFEKYFLRKDGISDTSYSQTRFTKDISTDSNVNIGGVVKSNDFRQGDITGAGYGLYRNENGASVIEADHVVGRRSFTTNEINVNQVTYFGGKQVFSAAGMICSSVEELADSYKCTFDTKQGTLRNMFAVGDQAYHQRSNPSNSEIVNYFWKPITEVGDDFIIISKNGGDGSGKPEIGSSIAQLGHPTDASRQSAIEMDMTKQSGGLVTWFHKINTFNLNNKDSVSIGMIDGEVWAQVHGNAYIGERDKSTYLRHYNGVTEFKGRAEFTSGKAKEDIDKAITDADKANSKIDGLEIGGVNLLVQHTSIHQHAVNQETGDLYMDVNHQSSDFIQVDKHNSLSISNNIGIDFFDSRIAFYDSNSTFISGIYYGGNSLKNGSTLNIVHGAKYIRFSTYVMPPVTPFESIMLEIGNKSTSWSPAPEDIQSEINAKSQTFRDQPTTPYRVGDIWFDSSANGGSYVCKTSRLTGVFVETDWELANLYDNTKTVIDGGLITSGTVQLAGDDAHIKAGITGVGTSDSSVRIWAGATQANKNNAPFRVLQSGKVIAKEAEIQGKFESNDSGSRIVIDPTTREFSIISSNGQIVGGFKFDEISGSSFSVMNTAFVDSGNNPLANTDISPFGVTMYDNIGDSKYANMTPSALEIGTNGVSANFKVSISMGRLVVRMKELPNSSLNVQSGELYTTSMNGHKVICQK